VVLGAEPASAASVPPPMSLLKLIIGRRVANREAEGRKLGVLAGLPAMGLDGLASTSYGPEAALTILAGTGAAGLAVIGPITWVILALLATLWFSYWQTITAYPSNGGAYVVAHENLGTKAGLLAAAALMLDYVLNVAVAIAAGVGALTSAIPDLHPFTLWICLGILLVVTVMNLRGTRESGLAWAVPTYAFILSLGFVIGWGVVKTIAQGGHPQPAVSPPHVQQAGEAVALWLILRAFASGCTAMTGVEAISNGVSAFREPAVKHAHGTLSVLVVLLGLLLLGIAHLVQAYGVTAMDQTKEGYQSVLSQLVGAVYGRGWFYYLTLGNVLAVLCLSANTSFVGFPRMCRLVAQDGFLPRSFALPGRRLVYSAGILFLAGSAGLLLVAFGGITDRLIPLFAVGAFTSFTLSQAGMAGHWHRLGSGWLDRIRLAINGFGAIATGAALVIILVAKFAEGAWLTLLVIPLTWLLLAEIRRYYDEVDREVLLGADQPLDFRSHAPPAVIIPINRWDRMARKAVEYAVRISPYVTALHITNLTGPDGEEHTTTLRLQWRRLVEQPARDAGLRPPRLRIESSPYRSMFGPVLRLIQELQAARPGCPVSVLLPEMIEGRPWAWLLHTHRVRGLRSRLLRAGGPELVVVSVPWQLATPEPRQVLAEEEPTVA
jgi:amino acid transporter